MKSLKTVFGVILLAAVLMVASSAHAAGMLQIKGSDTLINLVQRLSEVYMEENPGSYIAVTGGGSGTGVAALINNKCDIANASRLMKPKEVAQATNGGVTVKRVVIAMDGLSVITNGDSPITQLTMDEIGKIFRGEITNWSEVGGDNLPITMYGRQSNSGTFVFFRDFVLKGDYSQKMNRMNGNAQIVEAVKADKGGIGYVGVGYVQEATGLNVLEVAAKKGGYYASPLSEYDVKEGKYPITRPLNQYINGDATGSIKEFLEFELSEAGQKIVAEEGFFPIPAEYSDLNANAGL